MANFSTYIAGKAVTATEGSLAYAAVNCAKDVGKKYAHAFAKADSLNGFFATGGYSGFTPSRRPNGHVNFREDGFANGPYMPV